MNTTRRILRRLALPALAALSVLSALPAHAVGRLADINGQTIVFFVLVVAAAEVVVGLGIIVSIMRRRSGVTVDDLAELKG